MPLNIALFKSFALLLWPILFCRGAYAEPLSIQLLSNEKRNLLCSTLLQTDTAQVQLPYDINTIQFLTYFADIYIINSNTATIGGTQYHTPGMQKYIRRTSQTLLNQRATEIKTLGLAVAELQPASRAKEAVHIHNGREMTAAEFSEAYDEAYSQLHKLPAKLLNFATASGRTLVVTAGPITNYPGLQHLRGITPRGWYESWDNIPGAGGNYAPYSPAVINIEKLNKEHGSRNLILHEMLHNIDSAYSDFRNQNKLSDAPQFLELWQHTEWHNDELTYEALYPEEAFAEFGAKYFDSQESRQMLLDKYPHWHEYFEKLAIAYSQRVR